MLKKRMTDQLYKWVGNQYYNVIIHSLGITIFMWVKKNLYSWYKGVYRSSWTDLLPGARTANGTALCH
jgi:hypothetical protein